MIRTLQAGDVEAVLADLTPYAQREFEGADAPALVREFISRSFLVKTVEYKGKALAVGGVVGEHLLDDGGVVWILWSNGARRHSVVVARDFVKLLRSVKFSRLWSWVDEECYVWTQKLGFTVEEPEGSLRHIWRLG